MLDSELGHAFVIRVGVRSRGAHINDMRDRGELGGRVVVITGASSGLGRATAVEFARRGCVLYLAARRREALEDTARTCRAEGASSVQVVVTDVTREEEVQRLAREALARVGRIDVWVSNAGVTVFAPLEQGAFEVHRRVIETNLFGPMHCARAVIPIFRRQHGGVLINVGSVLSEIGQPFVPSYVISKFALRGLSEALRTELADDPGIHVCTIFPYAIDTPHFQAAASEVGRQARAMPPVQSPEKVARAVVRLAAHPRRERHVPRAVVFGLALHRLQPRTVERLLLRALRRWHFSAAPERRSAGNLYRPSPEPGTVHGRRPPQVGTLRVAAWTARETVRIKAQNARRRLERMATVFA